MEQHANHSSPSCVPKELDLPYGTPSLANLLQFFNPCTIEEKLALVDAYLLINDFTSCEALIFQLYEDIKSGLSRLTLHSTALSQIEMDKIQEGCDSICSMLKSNLNVLNDMKRIKYRSRQQIDLVPPPGLKPRPTTERERLYIERLKAENPSYVDPSHGGLGNESAPYTTDPNISE